MKQNNQTATWEETIKKEWDGSRECNYSEEIQDEQCEVCLDTIIRDWYIMKSFKRHSGTKRAICIDCQVTLRRH